MNILADESIEAPVVQQLQSAGFDVVYIAEIMPGIGDARVLQFAADSDRLLLTNDKDFAELTFLRQSDAPGIVLVRLPHARSREKGVRLIGALAAIRGRVRDRFTVVSADAIRSRKFPVTK